MANNYNCRKTVSWNKTASDVFGVQTQAYKVLTTAHGLSLLGKEINTWKDFWWWKYFIASLVSLGKALGVYDMHT